MIQKVDWLWSKVPLTMSLTSWWKAKLMQKKKVSNLLSAEFNYQPIYVKWTLLPQLFEPVHFQKQGVWLVVIINMGPVVQN